MVIHSPITPETPQSPQTSPDSFPDCFLFGRKRVAGKFPMPKTWDLLNGAR